MAKSVTPFLMFEGAAEAAANLYVSLFRGSSNQKVERYAPRAGRAGELGRLWSRGQVKSKYHGPSVFPFPGFFVCWLRDDSAPRPRLFAGAASHCRPQQREDRTRLSEVTGAPGGYRARPHPS